MRHKQLIVISLCLGILFSNFAGITFGKEGTRSKLESTQQVDTKATLPDIPMPDDRNYEVHQATKDGNESLVTGSKEQLGGKLATDPYTINAEELEQFMDQGYALEDIFQADQIGNELGIDPKSVLANKEENEDWENLRTKLMNEQQDKFKQELKQQFPDEYNALTSSDLTDDEKYTLLLAKKENEQLNLENLADDYKLHGRKAITEAINEVKVEKSLSSSSEMSRSATNTPEETLADTSNYDDLPPALVQKFKAFAEANNVSLDELLQKFRAEHQRQTSAFTVSSEVD